MEPLEPNLNLRGAMHVTKGSPNRQQWFCPFFAFLRRGGQHPSKGPCPDTLAVVECHKHELIKCIAMLYYLQGNCRCNSEIHAYAGGHCGAQERDYSAHVMDYNADARRVYARCE